MFIYRLLGTVLCDCESSILLQQYSDELLIEYYSSRLLPEVDINYRVVHNNRTCFSFKSVVQEQLEMIKIMSERLNKSLSSRAITNCN